MTKAELTERIIDALIDPWNDDPDDYLDLKPIDLEEAEGFLKEIRANEASADLEPDECLPEDVTPANVQEVWNCLIRARKHEAYIERLTDWLKENNDMALYDNYRADFGGDKAEVVPVDWFFNSYSLKDFPFALDHPLDLALLISIAQNSRQLNLGEHEYCWYDKEHNALVGTNTPYEDGIADAPAFAEYILSPEGKDCLEFILDSYMDDDDVNKVFGCTKEELING